jgi:hypothetical protein
VKLVHEAIRIGWHTFRHTYSTLLRSTGGCGGNARFLSAVGNQGDNVFGELKDLFRIGDQATKNDYRFFS